MKIKETEFSEMLAYKIQTPGNYSEERIQQMKNTAKELIAAYFSTVLTFPYLVSYLLERKIICAPENNFGDTEVFYGYKICRNHSEIFT
jgi:hypothetical protein